MMYSMPSQDSSALMLVIKYAKVWSLSVHLFLSSGKHVVLNSHACNFADLKTRLGKTLPAMI